MISHDLKCIFVHQPRTAGTSIESALIGKDWWSVEPLTKHLTSRAAAEIYRDYWDDYLKFTVVRNPYSWFVSLYFTHNRRIVSAEKSNAILRRVKNGLRKEVSFSSYCMNPIFSKYEPLYSGHQHKNVSGVDFVLRFERLNEDFRQLCQRLDIDRTLSFSHSTLKCNQTERYQKHYSDKLVKKIEKVYEDDFKMFGYSHLS